MNYLALPGIAKKNDKPHITRVLNIVSEVCKISPEQIKARSRKEGVVLARHLIIYICRKWHGRTTLELAKYFAFDHSTIVQNTKAISNWLETDESVKEKYHQIIEKLNF